MRTSNKSDFKVPNQLASDSSNFGVLKKIDPKLIKNISTNQLNPKPLLICSGGTSSRCAADNLWTLDLRENYQQIIFNKTDNYVDIGAGVKMGSLLNELSKYGRSFPTGLSGQTGSGYLLTGGISPISRNKGLAIDRITKMTGIWGTGEKINISKPNELSTFEERLIWRGLLGAAPFLGIITNIQLQTDKMKPLFITEAIINSDQLAEGIYQAESWPNNASFNWIWKERIKVYIVIEIERIKEVERAKEIIEKLPFSKQCKTVIKNGLKDKPDFALSSNISHQSIKFHNEVIGLLGGNWNKNSDKLINSLNRLMAHRPSPECYLASQQLGGATTFINKSASSFMHRNAIWKPWISGAWIAGDIKGRSKSLHWMEEVWKTLECVCPGIHLAQMHPHLPWHEKELKLAFLDWLPGLQNLKSKYDPQGLLPPL
ncbi:FAD-binding protein [Prochlorococcus sp. MIT 1223]|uniref:FAD-binding protein n=1 Tax=Prochlorococcus sp. MIT 1223 TaxID=3096217 RepID=UPI002A7475DA|nr:FAD-binding protein [Prochlorococcus sp. MIT 1223]